MRIAPGAWAAVLVALVGCGPPSSRDDPETESIERSEIEAIHPELQFTGVRDMVLSDGVLWVLDATPPFLTRVSLTDGEIIQFGGNGQGPGEFRNPWSIQPTVGAGRPGVDVWDLGNRRVSRFGDQGALLDSEPLSQETGIRVRGNIREVSFVDPFRIRTTGAGLVASHFPTRADRTSDMSTGSLTLVDWHLQPGPELARFAEHVAVTTSNMKEWASVPLWDACDGVVVLWSPVSSQVLWLDAEGRVDLRVPVEVPLHSLTVDDIETFLRRMARLEMGPGFETAGIDFKQRATQYRDRFSEFQPSVTDIRCESSETVWLRLFSTAFDPLGRSQTWIRLSHTGDRRWFTFHHEFTPVVFSNQGVFGLINEPDGSQRLGRWGNSSDLRSSLPSSSLK